MELVNCMSIITFTYKKGKLCWSFLFSTNDLKPFLTECVVALWTQQFPLTVVIAITLRHYGHYYINYHDHQKQRWWLNSNQHSLLLRYFFPHSPTLSVPFRVKILRHWMKRNNWNTIGKKTKRGSLSKKMFIRIHKRIQCSIGKSIP